MSYQYLAIVCTDGRHRTLSITTTISNTFGTGFGEYFTRLVNLLHITKLLTQDSKLLDWGCGSPRHSFSWTGQLAHRVDPGIRFRARSFLGLDAALFTNFDIHSGKEN